MDLVNAHEHLYGRIQKIRFFSWHPSIYLTVESSTHGLIFKFKGACFVTQFLRAELQHPELKCAFGNAYC